MNKDEINKTVQNWLNKNKPEGTIIVSCGSAGALIVTKQPTEWQTVWADHVIIYSDIDNNHCAARILQTEEKTTSVDSDAYACHCGRKFTKRFALTNHQKVCKQVPKPVDEITKLDGGIGSTIRRDECGTNPDGRECGTNPDGFIMYVQGPG
jgi:hypothetical protein